MSDRIGLGQNDDKYAEQTAQDVAASNGQLAICTRCGGSGNELYSMFRKCSNCDGVGAIEVVSDE